MRNIGIVTTWFERGAAYVSRQFMEVLEKEHNVFIYARGGEAYAKNDPKWNHENVYWGKRNPMLVSSKINKNDFLRWIKENRIDCLLFNEQQIWTPLLWCHEMKIPAGAYIDYYTKETAEFFSAYDFLICNTQKHFSVFKNHSQSYFVPWGTDVELYKPLKKRVEDSEKMIFFHSAGMNPLRKGTDLFIKAMDLVKNEYVKAVVHTQVDLSEFFPKLTPVIKKIVDNGKLEIIQKTVSAPGLYHMGDVYVYPTRLEGIGLTIAEALSCGLPVITTNERPMSEFVKSNETGSLVRVKEEKYRGDGYYWPQSICDENHLAEIISEFAENPEHVKQMGNNARNRAVEELDWNKNSLILYELFENVAFIDELKKKNVLELCERYERSRSWRYYLNTFKPYIYLKRRFL
ncbi:glycosyltransferase family 4 protein [Natronoflexus pectinivorans]|uniref:Glycosyltransferase involved in cell wall biosynthesis n=1 Tax=Natronoflexus pectinivorans TaxID=682526 RepID=A0A4R2GKH5_9BACT|nr:glycosyltransferase family 4 protein [Natronoflexus pectinivorans]TCO07889.1 glycosyltransferase involved in cell wall biosynthesis [Natronoflexus pectinivorans]